MFSRVRRLIFVGEKLGLVDAGGCAPRIGVESIHETVHIFPSQRIFFVGNSEFVPCQRTRSLALENLSFSSI